MHQITLQDDSQGQWCCGYRHVHPVSPTDSHADQTHSSASTSPHVIHLRVSNRPSPPQTQTWAQRVTLELDLEGGPSGGAPLTYPHLFSRVPGHFGEILHPATGQAAGFILKA